MGIGKINEGSILKILKKKEQSGNEIKIMQSNAFVTETILKTLKEVTWHRSIGYMSGKINWFYNYVWFDITIQVKKSNGKLY